MIYPRHTNNRWFISLIALWIIGCVNTSGVWAQQLEKPELTATAAVISTPVPGDGWLLVENKISSESAEFSLDLGGGSLFTGTITSFPGSIHILVDQVDDEEVLSTVLIRTPQTSLEALCFTFEGQLAQVIFEEDSQALLSFKRIGDLLIFNMAGNVFVNEKLLKVNTAVELKHKIPPPPPHPIERKASDPMP